jgi:hypothetical protein
MPKIALHFELDPGMGPAQLEEVQKQLREQIKALDPATVKKVATRPERMRLTGVEVIAAISMTIVIVENTEKLVEETQKLVAAIGQLIGKIRGLKRALVDVEDQRVPAGTLTREQVKQAVQP